MTPAEYAREALERAEKATEGPWAIWRYLDHQGFKTVGDAWSYQEILDDREAEECNPTAHVYVDEDAEFIAAARSDVPRLARAVIAVTELHHPVTEYPGGNKQQVCEECYHPSLFGVAGAWPCPTIRALSDALEVES